MPNDILYNYPGDVNYIPETIPQAIPSYINPYVPDEAKITNIVAQIDPKTIIDNLDHALLGEHYNKERMEWVMNVTGKPIVNDACRGAIISYLDGILTNNTTMGNIDEKRLSFLMESVIDSIKRMFVVNLEEFGFVKTAPKKILIRMFQINYLVNEYELEKLKETDVEIEILDKIKIVDVYENIGTPDSARMTLVANMVYKVCFLVFSRALKGQESIRIFKSLSMSDSLYGGMGMQQQQKSGWLGKLFGR